MKSTKKRQIEGYINAIRNSVKKDYAIEFLAFLESKGPEPDFRGLSYMAAQAVRIELHRIVGDIT